MSWYCNVLNLLEMNVWIYVEIQYTLFPLFFILLCWILTYCLLIPFYLIVGSMFFLFFHVFRPMSVMSTTFYLTFSYNWNVVYNNPRLGRVKTRRWQKTLHIDGILPKAPTRHAYAWQIGPFWQYTLDMKCMRQLMANEPCHGKELLTMLSLQHTVFFWYEFHNRENFTCVNF